MLGQDRKWCQAEPEATKSTRSGHQQPQQQSLLWISTKIWERVQKTYFRKCSYIREEWLFSWFGIPCALKQSDLSRVHFVRCKILSCGCPGQERERSAGQRLFRGSFGSFLVQGPGSTLRNFLFLG